MKSPRPSASVALASDSVRQHSCITEAVESIASQQAVWNQVASSVAWVNAFAEGVKSESIQQINELDRKRRSLMHGHSQLGARSRHLIDLVLDKYGFASAGIYALALQGDTEALASVFDPSSEPCELAELLARLLHDREDLIAQIEAPSVEFLRRAKRLEQPEFPASYEIPESAQAPRGCRLLIGSIEPIAPPACLTDVNPIRQLASIAP